MREIRIDEDTRIYYVYEDKSYYIENKNTTTPRTTATNAKHVLDIVAPSNTVTIDDLISLAETYETLTSLSYTWEDTGAYIKTVQLNDFSTHPICIDCEKSKLYIMNTEIIFDLTLTEGRRYRLDTMQAYFKDTLGLSLTLQELTDIYTLLVTYYNPTPYNVIDTDSNPLYYTNQIKLSNYRHTSPILYTLTKNPNNQYTYNVLGHILSIESNAITLSAPVPSSIQVGQTLNVFNAYTTVDTATYTADGSYVVQSISNNTIYTTENLSSPYLYEPPILSVVAYKNNIVSVNRDNSTITLEQTPTEYLVGDTIVVYGTSIQTEYETLSVDGTYTIMSIQGKTITTEETPVTDYTYTTGTNPYVYKAIFANNVNTITDTHVIVEGELSSDIAVNTPIVVNYPDNTAEFATVIGKDGNMITIDDTLTNFTPNYGLLRGQENFPETLIAIEESKLAEIMPLSSFIVDNDEQCTAYIQLAKNAVAPTEENYSRYSKPVLTTMQRSIGGKMYEMVLKGLYGSVYKD